MTWTVCGLDSIGQVLSVGIIRGMNGARVRNIDARLGMYFLDSRSLL